MHGDSMTPILLSRCCKGCECQGFIFQEQLCSRATASLSSQGYVLHYIERVTDIILKIVGFFKKELLTFHLTII